MASSKLDSIYRRLLISRFFEKGWGTPENLHKLFEFRKIISCRETCYKLVPPDYPVKITSEKTSAGCTILEGRFFTPFALHLPSIVPKEALQAHFQVILPLKWKHERHKPVCIQMAGTGDHYFWRRRIFVAKPLLKEAEIGSIILENPFYGLRKPKEQTRSNLHNVSDIFVMGGCLILEGLVLLHWCERNGFGPLGLTGLSMGGHMASLAATNWPKPLVLVPCLSWSTGAAAFTNGVLSESINWKMLAKQYYADDEYYDKLSKIVHVQDPAFTAGKKFVRNFNESLNEIKQDIDETQRTQHKTHGSSPILVQNSAENPLINRDDNRNITTLDACSSQNAALTKYEDTSALTKLMRYILPKVQLQHRDAMSEPQFMGWELEIFQFMRGIMDECTHLKNFSVPIDTSLIIVLCAKADGYVPRDGCQSLADIWPGAEIRYLDAGHVSAYICKQKIFRASIIEAFEKAKQVYDQRALLAQPSSQPITSINSKQFVTKNEKR